MTGSVNVYKQSPTRNYLDQLSRKGLYKKIAELADRIISVKKVVEKREGEIRALKAQSALLSQENSELHQEVRGMMIKNMELIGKVLS